MDHESFHCNESQYQVPRDVLAKLKKEARGRGPLDTHNFLKSKANIVKTKKVKFHISWNLLKRYFHQEIMIEFKIDVRSTMVLLKNLKVKN